MMVRGHNAYSRNAKTTRISVVYICSCIYIYVVSRHFV